MATGKEAKKTGVRKTAAVKKGVPAKAVVKLPESKIKVPSSPPLREKLPVPPKRSAGPTARACPLVLDGELEASDFSPADCLTCSEFDCRFCEAEEGSSSLRSRLFAGADDNEEAEDAWGGDSDFDGCEEGGGEEEGGEEDQF